MDDLISRQAAINAPVRMVSEGIEWIPVYHVEDLPTAQPEQRWIPVTERLPEVRQWVLCQCRAGIMDVLRLTDDGCWYRKFDMIYMSGFVLAWMPLPEPYKGEQNGKNS